jgi:hypothetical protein
MHIGLKTQTIMVVAAVVVATVVVAAVVVAAVVVAAVVAANPSNVIHRCTMVDGY